jgi:CheY-like chemotaxis protein
VEIWHWDEANRVGVPRRYSVDDAGIVLAAQLVGDLMALDPDHELHRRLYLVSQLEAARIHHGFVKPIHEVAERAHQLALDMGPPALEQVLTFAMAGGHTGAAIGTADILGQMGTRALLYGPTPQVSPLVRAVAHGDRRLRFAAIRAIMKLDPTEPYVGSSHLPEALGFFVSTQGVREALVASRRPVEGRKLASMLVTLGYDADVAASGRRLLRSARDRADVELVLIDMRIAGPPAREVVYRLRRDWRTSCLPIALLVSSENIRRAQSLAAADPLTIALAQPHEPDAVKSLAARLIRVAGRTAVTGDERQEQAIQALKWLAHLSAKPETFYDVRRQLPSIETALYVEGLTGHAADVLAHAGVPTSQKALVDFASQGLFPLENRQMAATALRLNVDRHGVLLTTEEILHQYTIYNASDTADRETQAVLSAILDTLERKQTENAGATMAE